MMEMKENVMTKIDFITAAGGGIRMYAGDGLKGWVELPRVLLIL